MERRIFAEEMRIIQSKAKDLFFAEYWSGYSCLRKDEEQKLLNAIRKIFSVIERMEQE